MLPVNVHSAGYRDPAAPPSWEKLLGWCEGSWWAPHPLGYLSHLQAQQKLYINWSCMSHLKKILRPADLELTNITEKKKKESKIKFHCLQIAFSK